MARLIGYLSKCLTRLKEKRRQGKYYRALNKTEPKAKQCSFLIPSRNRPDVLGQALENLLKYTSAQDEIVVAIHLPGKQYDDVIKKFEKRKVKFIFINYQTSLSKIWNKLIQEAKYPDVFILNDKARPTAKDILKARVLSQSGIGLCGLYRFGFFHFNKYLIYMIGWFDERLVDGGYEDCDFLRRLVEKDIAYYESEEAGYLILPSTFKQSQSRQFFKKKWAGPDELNRKIADQDLYKSTRKSYETYKRDYLPFEKSSMMSDSHEWFGKAVNYKIKQK